MNNRFDLLIRDPFDGVEHTVTVTADSSDHAIAKGERLWPDCPILAWRESTEPKLIIGVRTRDFAHGN